MRRNLTGTEEQIRRVFFQKIVGQGKKRNVSLVFTAFTLSHMQMGRFGTRDILKIRLKPCISCYLQRSACVSLCHSVTQATILERAEKWNEN